MSRPRPLYGSRPLADWVRAGGRPGRPVGGHALRLSWHAFWFEQNWRTTAVRLAGKPLPDDPVFILGFWRSGTTVLHELIAAATGWTTPRTWQCFHPSTCFLSGPPSREAAAERPMDRGRIATFGPQEDEFALLLLGESSAYRGFLDPRRLDECARALRESSGISPAASADLSRWLDFVRGIAASPARAPGAKPVGSPGRSPGRRPAGTPVTPPAEGSAESGAVPALEARLLLKSPGHTFRLPELRASFPRARYIWIGRDSAEVLASNERMWRAMIERYALWDTPPCALEDFLLDVLGVCAEVLERCLDEMSADDLLWVDFASLVAQPRPVLEGVLDFLARDEPVVRDPARIEQGITRALAQVPVHTGARSSRSDDERARAMDRVMSAARQRFGRRLPPIQPA